MSAMNHLVEYVFEKICNECRPMLPMSNKKTLTDRETRVAVALMFPDDFGDDAIKAAQAAVEREASSFDVSTGGKKEPRSRSTRAGLVFPVGRVARRVVGQNVSRRMSRSAATFIAATLEFVTKEILLAAAKHIKKKKRINPRHIRLGIAQDDDLRAVFGKDVVVVGGGVIPMSQNAIKYYAKKADAED